MLFPLAIFGLDLHWVFDHISRLGYPLLFGMLFSCGLGVPIPEDLPLLVAGYFVADGKMSLGIAAITAWCGIMGGDCMLYMLGRLLGPEITKVPMIGTHINKDRLEKTHQYFEKYGVWVVAIGRLFAGIRGAMVLTAGTIRYTFWHFLLADGAAAVVSGGLFMALGFWIRKRAGSLDQISEDIKKYQLYVLAGIVVLVLAFVLWQWWKNKRRRARVKAAQKKAALLDAQSKHGKSEKSNSGNQSSEEKQKIQNPN
jgi:membrane protein DedA with SNARE-associated domain